MNFGSDVKHAPFFLSNQLFDAQVHMTCWDLADVHHTSVIHGFRQRLFLHKAADMFVYKLVNHYVVPNQNTGHLKAFLEIEQV